MGGGQSSTKNSTSVTETSPWNPAQPGLMKTLNDAETLYNAGIGSQIYGGQRVADFSQDQSSGIQSTRDQAASDNAGGIGTAYLQNTLANNGMSPYTQQGVAMLQGIPNIDGTGSVLKGAGLDRNGLTGGQVAALGQLGNVQGVDLSQLQNLANTYGPGNIVSQVGNNFMNGQQDLTTQPQLQKLFDQTQLPSYAETNLAGVARGDFLDPTTNPYVQALVKNANQNADTATREAYAQSGRYGSGNFSGAMTKAIADVDTNLYANQYNTERQNQMSANQLTDAARMGRLGLGQAITNDISGVQNTNNQNRLAGAGLAQTQAAQQAGVLGQLMSGGQFNSGLGLNKAQAALSTYGQGASNNLSGATTDASNDLNTQQFNANLGLQRAQGTISAGQQGLNTALSAAGLLPATDALRYAPGSNLLQVGGLQQSQNQNQLNAAQQYFNETQQVPWQALSEYASFPTAIGSMGGQSVTNSTEQTKTKGASPLQSILGLGTSLLGLGTGGGATLGGGLLSGLFSDERVKENIKEVGELHDGQKMYSYNYKGDPTTQVGLLAQEVAQNKPDAVMPSGIGDIMMVDYGKATEDAAKKGGGSPGSSAPAAPPSPSTPSESDLRGIGQAAAAQMAGPMMQAALQAMGDPRPAPASKSVTVVVAKPVKSGKAVKSRQKAA